MKWRASLIDSKTFSKTPSVFWASEGKIFLFFYFKNDSWHGKKENSTPKNSIGR